VLQWSRVSDYIGRKPVILIGLLGTTLSMLAFGLSRTFLDFSFQPMSKWATKWQYRCNEKCYGGDH